MTRIRHRRPHSSRASALLIVVFFFSSAATAQPAVTLGADVTFYGDNTEFHNPFREGETIFGAALRVAAISEVSNRIAITIGAFGNQRFGSDDAFEIVRPILALTVTGRRSRFVFGTFPPRSPEAMSGPDLDGPHGLLPALQRETLAFDRPFEAGLQWTFEGSRITHEMWIEWQRLNTPEHRERFDGGLTASLMARGPVSIPVQVHIVHEGGQQFSSGPVADSAAAAAGLRLGGRIGALDSTSLELYGLASRFVPDRSKDERSQSGGAFFGRASAVKSGWRAHLIVWRGTTYIKDEGDPNYQSIRLSGTVYGGTRDYSEAGVTRTFKPAPGVGISVSARLHRVEKHYEYSYRVLAATALRWRVR